MRSLEEIIDSTVQIDPPPKEIDCVLFRADGIPLFSRIRKKATPVESATLSALMAGMWQAAEGLSQLTGSDFSQTARLGLDNSHSGFYILPLQVRQFSLFLGMVYDHQTNPAKLKNQIRTYRDRLNNIMVEKSEDPKLGPQSAKLFENVTDEEVDQLFSGLN